MAYSFSFDSTTPMALKDYVDLISTDYDVYDQDSLKESAWALHALSLDRSLFDDIISTPIKSAAAGSVQSQNIYTDATFILDTDTENSFFVRANVWKKPRMLAGTLDFENRLYSYHQPHDHNFDFVTVGYFGPGYRTQIYEYDHDGVIGRTGEPVPLTLLEDTYLPQGKVMQYRRCADIHTQIPPESTSISLNLMIPSKEQRYRQQYAFDLERQTVSGFVDGHSSYRVSVLELAGELGGENAIEPLLEIARANPCPRARATAVKATRKIAPSLQAMLLSRCGADMHPLVQEALAC